MKRLISLAFLLLGGLSPTGAPALAKVAKDAAPAAEKRFEWQRVDLDRIYRDKDYARELLAGLDRADLDRVDSVQRRALMTLRGMALFSVGRYSELVTLAQQLARENPGDVGGYAMLITAGIAADQPLVAIDALETAMRSLSFDQQRQTLRAAINEDVIRGWRQEVRKLHDETARSRLAEALLALQWPDPEATGELDYHRFVAADARLARGDVEGARRFAQSIELTEPLLRLLVQRRFDTLFDPGKTREQRIVDSIARTDRWTAARLAAAPEDWERLQARAQFLRDTGRPVDAYALLAPRIEDMAKVEAGGDKALWTVDEAANDLVGAGRPDEAVALMRRLLALGTESHPMLINMEINLTQHLNSAGRFDEAAAAAARLDREAGKLATTYGYMWIWSNAACASALGKTPAKAAPWVAKLAAHSADNRDAHMYALLCTGDVAGAERILLERLAGDEAETTLAELQDYQLEPKSPALAPVDARVAELRERPLVKAAIERVGRIMSLPLANFR